jgi:hypothetical protein
MKKFPWIRLPKKTDPETPLEPPVWFGNTSNGEYFHVQTKHEAKLRKEILTRADEQARYLGMDRRDFLASSMGLFATMAAINQFGCSSDDGAAAKASGAVGDGGPLFSFGDGPYVVPPGGTCDPAHEIALSSSEAGADGGVAEFIMDVQTHSFDNGEWRTKNIVYPTFLNLIANCSDETNKLDCFDQNHYAELMFVDSDTTMSVITSWPAATCFDERKLLGNDAIACGLPLSNIGMRELRDWLNSKVASQRMINQVQVMPNDMLEHQLEGMYAAVQDPTWRTGSWKCYPAWTSDTYPDANGYAQGYFLTDPVGIAFVEAGLKLGVPNFAIHKGLPIPGFDVEHNKPTDIGPIAKMFPTANFVIYHSGINAGTGGTALAALSPTPTEKVPYDPKDPAPLGVNMLIRSLFDAGLLTDAGDGGVIRTPNLNVYAEMGSAWSQVMRDPNQAQHYIGKLLKYFGPDNIVWGTDCILYGSPQVQIEMFRSFQITAEYQDTYGYPAITPHMKRKIFGLNAARIYHIDTEAKRCIATQDTFAMIKRELDETIGNRRWTGKPPLGPRTYTEFVDHAREEGRKGLPG